MNRQQVPDQAELLYLAGVDLTPVVDVLLVPPPDGKTPGPLVEYVDLLIKWGSGDLSFGQAARSYAARKDFSKAGRCLQRLRPEDEAHGAVMAHFLGWVAGQRQQISELAGQLGSAGAMDAEGPDRVAAAWVGEHLSSLESRLAAVESAAGDALCDQLLRWSPKDVQDVEEGLGLAEMEIADAVAARKERERRLVEELRRLKSDGDRLIMALVEAAAGEPAQLDVLSARLLQAFRSRDVAACRETVALLQRLQAGERIEVGSQEPPQPVPPGVRPARPSKPSWTRPEPVELRWEDLSPFVRRAVDDPERGAVKQSGASPAASEPVPPTTWEPEELERLSPESAAALARIDLKHRGRHPSLGTFLIAHGRRRLLRGEFDLAVARFREAVRWAYQPAEVLERERVEALERWRAAAGWGFLLALGLTAADDEERKAILRPDNLRRLARRPIAELPLAFFADRGLMRDLGIHVVVLGASTGYAFSNDVLFDFLLEWPVATYEYLEGICAAVALDSGAAAQLLGATLRRIGGKAEEELARYFEETTQLDAPNPYEALVKKMPAPHPESSIGAWVEKRLDVLSRGHRAVTHLERKNPLAQDLKTRAIPRLSAGRVVLSIHNLMPSPLYGVTPTVQLEAPAHLPSARLAGVSFTPRFLRALLPDERRLMPVVIKGAEGLAEGAHKLTITYQGQSADDQRRPLSTARESFDIDVRAADTRLDANPYVTGNAIQQVDRIYGREDEVEQALASLRGEGQDNVVLLVGDRRMGKTTVLNAIMENNKLSRYLKVKLDAEVLVPDTEIATLYERWLAYPIIEALRKYGVSPQPLRAIPWRQDPQSALRDFLRSVDSLLGTRRLLVVIDELERLLTLLGSPEGSRSRKLAEGVISGVRAAIQDSRQVSWLLSSVTDALRRHTSVARDRLFKLAMEIKIGPIPETEARRLIEKPTSGAFVVDSSALEWILQVTGRQPYLLQLVCHHLYNQGKRSGWDTVTRVDAQQVVREQILNRKENFAYLTSALDAGPGALDAQVVDMLARLQNSDEMVPLGEIHRRLPPSLSCSISDVQRVLDRLAEEASSVVSRGPGSGRYRLTVGLFAWHRRLLQEGRHSLVV